MDREAWHRAMVEELQNFINFSRIDSSEATMAVLATATQLVNGFSKKMAAIAGDHEGYVSRSDILETQIAILRSCIIDLEECKSFMHKEQCN